MAGARGRLPSSSHSNVDAASRPGPPGPIRTCVGCRHRVNRSDLLRVVVVDGLPPQVIPDPAGRRPGRGAYVHPDLGCFEQAERRRALPRALRVVGSVDVGPLRKYLDDLSVSAAATGGERTE